MCKISNIVLFQDTSLDVYMKYTNGLIIGLGYEFQISVCKIFIDDYYDYDYDYD